MTVRFAWLRRAACLLVLFCVARAEAASGASAPADVRRADALFREARELFAAGRLAEACKKFEESQALDPSPGTLLNLGACHREQGDILRSLADFRLAAEQAKAHTDATRRAAWSEAAEKELQALEPRIPILKWKSNASHPVSVFVDGVELSRPLPPLGTAVNPGAHRIEARAPGRTPWALDVRAAESQVLEVVIPELSAAQAPATSGSSSEPAARSSNVAPYVAFGISGLLLGSGVVTGLLARSAESDLEELCTQPDPTRSGTMLCEPSLESTRDRARTLGVVTDVFWAGALVSAGVGVFLVLNQPSDDADGARTARRRRAAGRGVNVGAGCGRAGCSVSVAGKF
jgi:hypothetical protein